MCSLFSSGDKICKSKVKIQYRLWAYSIPYILDFSLISQRCQRFHSKPKAMISHTKRIWDNVSLKSNKDILLIGIGVYLPYTSNCEALICVDARPLEKPLRPLDVETKLDSIDDNYSCGTTTIFAKVNKWYPSSDKTFELVIRMHFHFSCFLYWLSQNLTCFYSIQRLK